VRRVCDADGEPTSPALALHSGTHLTIPQIVRASHSTTTPPAHIALQITSQQHSSQLQAFASAVRPTRSQRDWGLPDCVDAGLPRAHGGPWLPHPQAVKPHRSLSRPQRCRPSAAACGPARCQSSCGSHGRTVFGAASSGGVHVRDAVHRAGARVSLGVVVRVGVLRAAGQAPARCARQPLLWRVAACTGPRDPCIPCPRRRQWQRIWVGRQLLPAVGASNSCVLHGRIKHRQPPCLLPCPPPSPRAGGRVRCNE
jgi:hypothetical protein